MKRDMELVRKIVLAIEACPTGYLSQQPEIEGYTDDQIGYHAYLMKEAGLVDGADASVLRSPSPMVRITNLTWKGHEFAEASRNDSIWRKAMSTVKEKGGAITIDLLKDLLTNLMKAHFGLP